LKITLIAVGKLKEKYFKEAVQEYQKRLTPHCSLQIIEVMDESIPEHAGVKIENHVKKVEADRVIQKIKPGSYVILLDVLGKKLSSEAFSEKLDHLMREGSSDITFVIGGSLGVHEALIKHAHFQFTMSDLTFPHQLARVILVEQIYRAFKILRGQTYHK
jgi:23S rRNA (pseudouridine1915-N3)-methyltransferase